MKMKNIKKNFILNIIIIFIMLIVGFFIDSKITENNNKINKLYNLAAKIENKDQFQYGLKNSIGNSLVYGEIKAANPVSMPEIEGEYFYIEKITEEYSMHTQTDTYGDAQGNIYTTTRIYYSWDYKNTESVISDEFILMDNKFNNPIYGLPVERLDLSKYAKNQSNVSSNYIYNDNNRNLITYYNIVTLSFIGTLETKLYNQKLQNFSNGNELKFYNNKNINETIEYVKNYNNIWKISFRIIWVILIIVLNLFIVPKLLKNKNNNFYKNNKNIYKEIK